MKICFPARKKGGKDYTSVDEIMTQVLGEPHGCWLAGSNLLWHGGLHISTVTAPDSVLTAETVDTAVPLQFMAGGEVVAWRLNRDYLTSQYNGQTLQYSSTFVLVKSVCQPDPQDSKTWLEFYSLYMGLAPLSAFPAADCWRVTDRGDGLRKRVYSGAEKEGQKAPVPGRGLLKKGARVAVIKQTAFELDGESQPFGLAKVLNKKGELAGAPFWVSLNPEYMKQEDTEYAHLPAWMQQAVKQGMFNEAVKPAAKVEVAAGDAVGFLSKDIDPVGMGKVETSHFAHIEILSNDARMPAFLDNPGKITTGKQYIRLHSGKSLYQKNGTGEASTFRAMSCVIVKDSGKILPVEKCNPLKDDQGKTWYEISPGNWMSESDVDVLHQYDLQALGFSALTEGSTSDMSASLREGWMKSLLNRLSEMVGRDRGIQQQQVSDYYKKAVSNIDTDGDGELSAEELFYAVHHPEMEIRNIAARMVVKHDSEWFGGSSHHKWEVYFQDYDLLRMKYAKQWRDNMEWMSKVEGFEKGEPVWHMHPIAFLSALKSEEDCAKLIWGEVVNQRLGAEKACLFRKKVVKICAEMWGEAEKLRYADVLMGCISVETNRMFTSSVVAYRKARYKNGEIIFVSGKSGPRPKIELHIFTRDELIKDKSIAEKNAVGLIQFTAIAVQQINEVNNISLTKLQLALMDEIEQLDYVKLYFTSNKEKFAQIKTPEDVYTAIFCPDGLGKSEDAVLYSKSANERAYNRNASLDSTENGNEGNNDGIIQKRELLARLRALVSEGEKYRNKCDCIGREVDGPDWMSIAFAEFNQYKNLIETDAELNNKIRKYHDTTNARGADGATSWCSSFVNWCFMQTKYAHCATHSALAYSWGQGIWKNGEIVDKPFYGAIAVMNYSHVGFVCGISPDGRLLILGGNQGGGREGKSNCISIRANSASSIKCLMKPKGYNTKPDDYKLKVLNISGPNSSYSDTH